jgi:glycosyltransferase involved in cell wall biosynthesis
MTILHHFLSCVRHCANKVFHIALLPYAYLHYRRRLRAGLASVRPRSRGSAESAGVRLVLHINTNYNNGGGAAEIARGLFAFQNDHGTRSLFAAAHNIPLGPNHIDLDRFVGNSTLLSRYARIGGWQYILEKSPFGLLKEPFFESIDLVHLHNIHGGYFNPLALPLLSRRVPVVWTLHDQFALTGHCSASLDCERWTSGCGNCPYLSAPPSLKFDSTAFLWRIKKETYSEARLHVVCPSRWLFDQAKRSILSGQSIHLIYNGIDTNIYSPTEKTEARKKLGLPLGKVIILFVANGGRRNPWKGGDFFDTVAENNVGNTEMLFLSLGERQEGERINMRLIRFPPEKSTMALYYSAADLLLYPSLADSFGLVVAEAMACGTPVVSFNTGGIPEIIEHGQNGYVARYKDLDDLQRGMDCVLQRQRDDSVADSARKRIVSFFSFERMANEYSRLYEEVLQTDGEIPR